VAMAATSKRLSTLFMLISSKKERSCDMRLNYSAVPLRQ
jgi:hypothetical protein